MIPCPSCGSANTERARFCAECGTALVAGTATTDASTAREVRKMVTVLFADVAGSTTLGEQLDPETLRVLLGRYFAVMKRIIELHGGTVEKFIGDAVMAVFGIPVVREDDALRAVRAAADIRIELDVLDSELAVSRGLSFRFRTGINTGQVVAGDSTGGQGFVTGDTVNTAARLEQAAAPGEILLGALTWQLVRDAVNVERVEPIEARGKRESVAAYRLVAVDPAMAGHVRRLDTPLVGRENELAALGNAFERVASERSCQLFTLLGAAGVGKSRLVAEFTASIAADATILSGRCLSYGDGITYWPIGEIVRSAARIEEGDGSDEARAKIHTLLVSERDGGVVAARIASAIGLSIEVAPQEEVFWAIRRLLEHLARDRPLVVVIEDIHWAEPTLIDLIEHIADWSRESPILLLCPARPDLLESRAGWSGGTPNATILPLEPLGSEATIRLIDALPGGSALPDDIQRRILAAAEGNPLYVEELLGMLVDDGLIVETVDGIWMASRDLATVRIPPSISALLTARLERLAPDERAVAARASVVGRVFEVAAVAELAEGDLRPDVNRCLLALVRKELLRPDRSELTTGDAYRFRHVLIRDAAYEALPKAERTILHERFADWLERIVGDRLPEVEEIVGYHLDAAYRYRTELGESGSHVAALSHRAGARLGAAGGRAFDRGDMTAAESLLSRAARVLDAGSPARLALMPELGFSLFSLGRVAEADEVLRVAEVEADAAGRPMLAIRARLEAALVRILSAGEHRAARETAESSIPILEREGDHLGLARAYLVIASAAWIEGRVEEAMKARGRALAHAARAGDVRTERRSTCWGAECYGPTPAIAAIAGLETTLPPVSGDPMRRAQTLFTLSGLYAMRGRIDEARGAYRDVRSILVDLGARLQAGAVSEIGGIAELIIGDADAADRWLGDGIEQLEGLGARGYHATLYSLDSVAVARQGRFEEALRVGELASAEGSPEDTLLQVVIQIGRATAFRGLGDHQAAVAAGREAVRLAEETDWVSYHADALLVLAEALRSSGETDQARLAAERARDLYIAKENLMGERRAAGFLTRQEQVPRKREYG